MVRGFDLFGATREITATSNMSAMGRSNRFPLGPDAVISNTWLNDDGTYWKGTFNWGDNSSGKVEKFSQDGTLLESRSLISFANSSTGVRGCIIHKDRVFIQSGYLQDDVFYRVYTLTGTLLKTYARYPTLHPLQDMIYNSSNNTYTFIRSAQIINEQGTLLASIPYGYEPTARFFSDDLVIYWGVNKSSTITYQIGAVNKINGTWTVVEPSPITNADSTYSGIVHLMANYFRK